MTTLRIQNIKKSYKNKDVVKDVDCNSLSIKQDTQQRSGAEESQEIELHGKECSGYWELALGPTQPL